MNDKKYTWAEAFDLMVNHEKTMIADVLSKQNLCDDFKDTSILFDKQHCLFKFKSGEIFSTSESNCIRDWVEYKEPRNFEWINQSLKLRGDRLPLGKRIIIETKGGNYICGIIGEDEIFMCDYYNFKSSLDTLGAKRWSYIPE